MATLTAPAAARAVAKERGLVRPPKPETLAPTAPKDSEKQIRIAQHREQKRIAREHLCPLLREVFPEQLVAGFSWRPPIAKTAVRSRCLAFPAFGLPLGARINSTWSDSSIARGAVAGSLQMAGLDGGSGSNCRLPLPVADAHLLDDIIA